MYEEQIRELIKVYQGESDEKRRWYRGNADAYLDIETTGLSPGSGEITIVGIYLTNETDERLVQIIGDDITAFSITQALDGVNTIFTYNGSHFDLPFINVCHGVNLASNFNHCDLMYRCWDNKLYGGLKAVECQLGISRLLEVNGYEAIQLWWRYIDYYDPDALRILLACNREDVLNLKILRERMSLY